jgi:hypothetical protein
MKIHTVVGDKGQYSDWTTWVVAGYFRKDTAESHARRLNEIVSVFMADPDRVDADDEAAAALAKEDPIGFSNTSYISSYSAPSYEVKTLEMRDNPEDAQ